MIHFLEKFLNSVNANPLHTAVVDRAGERRTSYRELDVMSGRVASWLKKNGIGKENVVAICVPRGVEFVAVRLAVMKAGAVWVGTESMMGAERIAYIIKDSGAALVVDEKGFADAMKEEPLPEELWADPDPHDLAFIYYTSGSTGRPKGVEQEYGVYDYIMSSTHRAIARWIPLDYANVAPETFIGGLYLMMGVLQAGCTLHLIPLPLVRDPAGLLAYFREKKVTASCMPPTLVKALESMGGLSLKVLHVSGEVVVDLYIDRFPVLNAYGPTEFSYLPFFFDIDRAYSNTPIGSPDEYTKLVLLDENGEVSSKEGVMCIQLPYFRGYLHDTERTGFVTVEGTEYFRSGDYMSVDGRGNYTLLGRVDDMVKINGNRIEPAEVEFAVRKVLGTDSVTVKAWERNGSRYLCAYHTAETVPDAAEMAELLKDLLPGYMIPSCYMRLDALPLNDNGKVNKRALPEPDDALLFSPYAAPETELQERICAGFISVLKPGDRRVGLDDDFFLLGGDSLLAISLIIEIGDPRLTVPMIYRGRTVRNIAEALEREERAGEKALFGTDPGAPDPERLFPLTEEQTYFLEQRNVSPEETTYYLSVALSLDPGMEDAKLEEALLRAFAAHPALLTVIRETEEGWRQQYCPRNNTPVKTEKITEKALAAVIGMREKPFAFDGSPLFRRKLYRTPKRLVLLLKVHHIICDGWSLKILVEDILSVYHGETLAEDPCFSILSESLAYSGSAAQKKDMEYFDNLCRGAYDRLPRQDFTGKGSAEKTVAVELTLSAEEVRGAAKRMHLSVTAFYLLASAMSIAAYNGSDRVLLSWNYHGRSDVRMQRSVGLLIKDYPAVFHFRKEEKISRAAADLAAQMTAGILHGRVSPFMKRDKEDLLCVLYQGNLLDYTDIPLALDVDVSEGIADRAAIEPMEIQLYEGINGLKAVICYDSGLYSRESAERFGKIFERICVFLAKDGSEACRFSEILSLNALPAAD